MCMLIISVLLLIYNPPLHNPHKQYIGELKQLMYIRSNDAATVSIEYNSVTFIHTVVLD